MTKTVTLEEAQVRLAELVAHMAIGETIVITKDHEPVASVIRDNPSRRQPRRPGNCKGMINLRGEDDGHSDTRP